MKAASVAYVPVNPRLTDPGVTQTNERLYNHGRCSTEDPALDEAV